MKRVLLSSIGLVALLAPPSFSSDEGCEGCQSKEKPVLVSVSSGDSLSAHVEQLCQWAEDGCAVSKKTLAALSSACNCKCDEVAEEIASLEKAAGNGCSESDSKLSTLVKISKKKAPKAAPPLSESVVTLAWWSKVGCPLAEAAFSSLRKETGTESLDDLKSELLGLEGACKEGCSDSTEMLAELQGLVKAYWTKLEAVPTSGHIVRLGKGKAHGCEECKTRLAYMYKSAGVKDDASLLASVKDLETKVDGGCFISKAKLGEISYAIWAEEEPEKAAKPSPLSQQVSQLTEWAGNGCSESKSALVSLKKACETDCEQELATKIANLEKWASNGCQESKQKLTKLTKLMKGSK